MRRRPDSVAVDLRSARWRGCRSPAVHTGCFARRFSFGQKKKGAPKKAASAPRQVAQGGQTLSTLQVPAFFTTAFGDPDRLQMRAERAAAKKAEAEAQLIPTPGRFLFALGRPDVLEARRAERNAAREWSSEFLAKARPDQGNYGEGEAFYDDGLTRLERNQMVNGREGFLTGAAKLRYRRITGQLEGADAEGITEEIQAAAGRGNGFVRFGGGNSDAGRV